MYCTKCGKPLWDDAKFCAFCGAGVKAPTAEEETDESVPRVTPDPQPVKKLGKKVKLAIILSACVVLTAATVFIIIPAVVEWDKGSKYESAMAFMDYGEYGEAKEVFLSLGEYKNAADLALECQNAMDYYTATQLMDAGKYQEAKVAFEVIAAYKDSAALAQECANKIICGEAAALIEAGSYTGALAKLEPLAAAGYKDCEKLIDECNRNLDYAQADAAFGEGKFYTAYTLFSSLGSFKDSAKRAAQCEQDYPATGETYRNGDYTGSSVVFKSVTPKNDPRPTLLKIYSADGTLVLSLFIRGGDAPTVKFPAGTYMIKSACGAKWYGPEEMFGDDAVYSTLLFESGSTCAYKRNFKYTLSLRVATDGNVDSEPESRENF